MVVAGDGDNDNNNNNSLELGPPATRLIGVGLGPLPIGALYLSVR